MLLVDLEAATLIAIDPRTVVTIMCFTARVTLLCARSICHVIVRRSPCPRRDDRL
jgi:hypothetical protein